MLTSDTVYKQICCFSAKQTTSQAASFINCLSCTNAKIYTIFIVKKLTENSHKLIPSIAIFAPQIQILCISMVNKWLYLPLKSTSPLPSVSKMSMTRCTRGFCCSSGNDMNSSTLSDPDLSRSSFLNRFPSLFISSISTTSYNTWPQHVTR